LTFQPGNGKAVTESVGIASMVAVSLERHWEHGHRFKGDFELAIVLGVVGPPLLSTVMRAVLNKNNHGSRDVHMH
jgi:hypothetical protein